MTLRIAVTIPSILPGFGGSLAETATLLRGKKHEERLLTLLEQRPITKQLHRLALVWGGASGTKWEVTGPGNADFSEL